MEESDRRTLIDLWPTSSSRHFLAVGVLAALCLFIAWLITRQSR